MPVAEGAKVETEVRPIQPNLAHNPFTGKVAVVTGEASGLGKAVSIALLERGVKVVQVDLSRDTFGTEKYKNQIVYCQADVSQEEDVARFIALAFEKFGRLDYLFSNAGILPPWDSFLDTTLEEFVHTLKVNLLGSFLSIRNACRELVSRECSEFSVVCSSSIAAVRADVAPVQYSASKGALLALVRSLQDFMLMDPRMHDMRVNAIVPGGMLTPMILQVVNQMAQRNKFVYGFDNTKFDHATPAEIADVVLFLLSNQSRHIRGQAIICDGGFSNSLGLRVRDIRPKANL